MAKRKDEFEELAALEPLGPEVRGWPDLPDEEEAVEAWNRGTILLQQRAAREKRARKGKR